MLGRVIGFRSAAFVCSVLLCVNGCKSKEEPPVRVPVDSIEVVNKKRRMIHPPSWINVVSGEGETLQVDQIAAFGAGCPRAGDPDIDGEYRDGCPLRGDKWNDLLEYVDSIKRESQGSGGIGYFKNSFRDEVDCNDVVGRPIAACLIGATVIFHFVEYFDSINVRYGDGDVYVDFRGYVNRWSRGCPKSPGGSDIADGGERDEAETILVLKAKRLGKIVMTSPSGVVRGDYLVGNRGLIPVSKKSLWPCSPVISIR